MKLVTDIEEAIYKECIPYKDTPIISNLANYNSEIIHAVANGTPLQKGYGRLIDANELVLLYDLCRKGNALKGNDDAFLNAIRRAQTIIEADKTESEK